MRWPPLRAFPSLAPRQRRARAGKASGAESKVEVVMATRQEASASLTSQDAGSNAARH